MSLSLITFYYQKNCLIEEELVMSSSLNRLKKIFIAVLSISSIYYWNRMDITADSSHNLFLQICYGPLEVI